MKLSIPMMVKNESKHLEKVLKSLECIRDSIETELIIIDTGSEDNTVEIARKFTDKVFYHEWNNNFAEMRNITLGYATGDWLLMIDGDEIIENSKPIIDFLNSNLVNKYNTGLLTIKNASSEDGLKYSSVFLAPRIFKNRPDFRYNGAIHNQPALKPPHYEIHSSIIHYGYIPTDKDLMEKKFERTSAILKQELEKDPENIYYWYQLSVTYRMHKDDNLAIEPAEKAYSLLKEKKKDYRLYIYVYRELITVYINNRNYDKAELICDEVLDFAEGYVDLHFLAGKVKFLRNKFKEAAHQYKMYLRILADYDNSNGKKDTAVTSYTLDRYEESYSDLAIIYKIVGEYSNALKYVKKIESKELKKKLLKNIVEIYVKLSDYNQMKEFYDSLSSEGDAKVQELMEMHIENIKTDISDEQNQELERAFSDVSTDYAVLNLVKLEERKEAEEVDNDVIAKIKKLDFSKLPLFYGSIIYYLIKRNYSLSDILSDLKLTRIRVYLDYFIKAYPDYHNTALGYIRNNPTKDLKDARINREIEKYALVLEKLEGEDFRYMLERYIDDGTYHITGIYHPEIIENEIVSEIKEDDEVFLMYLYKARRIKESDPVEYVRYLKKAIKVFPFRKAIEVLQEEIEKQLNPPVNDEMENLKKQFKENIKVLIAGNLLDQAEAVINQYEQIIKNDEEILLFKSHISLMKLDENKLRKKTH